jgi:hypothetical protein
MKTMLLVSASLAALGILSGCGLTRSPEEYRDATKAVLEKKNDDIRACYDAVLKASPGVAGTATVKFDVQEDTGKVANVTVDKATSTVPDPVADCVTKTIAGLAIAPPDSHKGEGTWAYQFAAPVPVH